MESAETERFHLVAFGSTLQGDLDTGVTPQADVWYHFRVQAVTGLDRVTLRAKVWAEGSAEPGGWQAEAYDDSATRVTAGAVGVRTYGPGSKYFDDLVVRPLSLQADFSAVPLTGTVPLTVTFTNLSTPTDLITSTLWAYGDGITGTTSALTHTHIYTRAGVYTVTLSVSDGVVTDTLTRTNYITATGGTVYTTTTRVIIYTYECAASLKRSERDKLYRLTGADYSSGESFAYGYDPVGNPIFATLRGTSCRTVHTRTLTTTTVITYAYDAANRLDYFYADGVPTDLTWDANGSLRTQGTSVYTWDAANRLVSANVDGVASSFEYDGSGNRTAQTVGEVTTEYVLDAGGELPEVIVATTGGASTRYVQVQGQILAQYEAGAWVYILPDHLGSVRQLVGSDDHVDLAQSYDPFSVLLEAAGAGASEFGYTGEQQKRDTGLVFLRARYYDPAVGRFLAKDLWSGVAQEPKSLHQYAYVRQNPVRYIDPLGLYDCLTSKQWPTDLVGLCLLFDNSPASRNWLYQYGITVGLGIVGWQDAQSMFAHWLGDRGETMYFGSRLVKLIERDAASLIEESRTEYLSYAAQQMRGEAGRLPPDSDVNFLSNAEGIPVNYLSNFDSPSPYRISEEVYIALGGFPLARTYGGTVKEKGQGTYNILLRTDFSANKNWTFAPNTQMYPQTPADQIPGNPPAEFNFADRIGFPDWLPRPSLIPPFIPIPAPGNNYWSIYIPDEWGYALEQEGYATPFLTTGRWAREEELLVVDRNCNGWGVDDVVEGPKITGEWLPSNVNPSLSENHEWVYR